MQEMKIGKIIAKTAIKTAIIFIGVIAVVLLAIGLISPRVMSQMGNKLGISTMTMTFAERAYKRSGDINDLGILVDRAISYEKYTIVEKYTAILVADPHFEAYARFRDQEQQDFNKKDFVYERYVRGNEIIALWKLKKYDRALSRCTADLEFQKTYPTNTLMSYLVDAYISDKPPLASSADMILDFLEDEQYVGIERVYLSDPTDENKLFYKNILIDLYRVHKANNEPDKAKMYYDKIAELVKK